MTSGIYLHFPFCKVKCMYCDFYSFPKRENEIPKFSKILSREIDQFCKSNKIDWNIDTIFLGGGTPSLFTKKGLELIFNTLDKNFNLTNVKEITMEINPGEAPLDKLKYFRNLGVNRISIGFQSFNQKLLDFLGRAHTANDSLNTFNNARAAGFENINIDLIFDIPGQSLNSWKKDLRTLVNLNPEHISAYSLTVEENTTLFTLVKSGKVKMPSEYMDLAMFSFTRDYLSKNNYFPYEVSNFSKKGMECRHNLHYWKLEKYLAFGPSAHGFDGHKRWWNTRSIDEYYKKINQSKSPIENYELLSKKDNFNELIFNGLRMTKGVKVESLSKFYQGNINNFIFDKTKKWDGLELLNNKLILNEKGILLADEISSDLFID